MSGLVSSVFGGKGQSAPATPDYAGAAKETAAGNLEAAKYGTVANRANQYTPYGSLTWQKGATDYDPWTQTINLNQTGRQLQDAGDRSSIGLANLQGQATDRVAQQQARGWSDERLGNLEGPLDTNSLPGMGRVYNPYQDTNQAQSLIESRLLPQQQRDRSALETRLANQGITQGSEAWKNAQDDIGRTQNDARQQAALSAIDLGMNQQGQTYNQANTNRSLSTNEKNQRYAQALQNRQQGLQEQNYFNTRDLNNLNSLRTGSQVTAPTFGSYAQQANTSGADMLGAAQAGYNSKLAGANANNANANNMMNGLFGLGSAYLGGK